MTEHVVAGDGLESVTASVDLHKDPGVGVSLSLYSSKVAVAQLARMAELLTA